MFMFCEISYFVLYGLGLNFEIIVNVFMNNGIYINKIVGLVMDVWYFVGGLYEFGNLLFEVWG